jgi:hypothetical protein
VTNTGTLAQGWWMVGVEFWKVPDYYNPSERNRGVLTYYNGYTKQGGNYQNIPDATCDLINDPNNNGILDCSISGNGTPIEDGNYSDKLYPNTRFLVTVPFDNDMTTASFEIKTHDFFQYYFSDDLIKELSDLGTLITTGIPGKNGSYINDFGWVYDYDNRIIHPKESKESKWRNDSLPMNRILSGGIWYEYRLRGMALYDGWGNEILYHLTINGELIMESAGKDGVFVWNPGQDGIYQTVPYDTHSSGDDLDGSKDNIRIGPSE